MGEEQTRKELSEAIIGSARTVLNVLEPGSDDLNITGLRLALLLNFEQAQRERKRIVR